MDKKAGLRIGDLAPDFTLPSHLSTDVSLKGFQGKKNVVLAFHPLAWTSV